MPSGKVESPNDLIATIDIGHRHHRIGCENESPARKTWHFTAVIFANNRSQPMPTKASGVFHSQNSKKPAI